MLSCHAAIGSVLLVDWAIYELAVKSLVPIEGPL